MKFSQLRIGARLGAGFALVLALVVVMAVVGVLQLRTIGRLNVELAQLSDTAELVDRCLSKDPFERPRSVIELSDGLVHAIASAAAQVRPVAVPAPVLPPIPAPRPVPVPPPRRHRSTRPGSGGAPGRRTVGCFR